MALKTNYHTHTTYCDGKNSPKEMVEAAIEKHFDILGFSGHSMYPHSSDWHIPSKNHEGYVSEINKLKEEYSGRIKIYCGFEADYIPQISQDFRRQYEDLKPDYLIGSVHYLVNENGFMTVDDSIQNVKDGIARLFAGDAKRAVQLYFATQRQMLSKGGFDILGHADLVRIRNAALNMFSTDEIWYREELKLTAESIRKAGVIVEINTGGIARGNIDDCYPSLEFLTMLNELNVPVTVSSDAHRIENLDACFDRAKKTALEAGYKELSYLEDGSIKFQKLELQ